MVRVCVLSLLVAVAVCEASVAEDSHAAANHQLLRQTTEKGAPKEETGPSAETIRGLHECFAAESSYDAICSRFLYARLDCLEHARAARQECLAKVSARIEIERATKLSAPESGVNLPSAEGGQSEPSSSRAAEPGRAADADSTESISPASDIPLAFKPSKLFQQFLDSHSPSVTSSRETFRTAKADWIESIPRARDLPFALNLPQLLQEFLDSQSLSVPNGSARTSTQGKKDSHQAKSPRRRSK